MTEDVVADLVRRGDPERWRAAMAAPPEARPGLMALYAFNLEVARAPWVASEPMLAEIRLRWWLDALDEIDAGAPPRRHEVVEPLAAAIRAGGLPVVLLREMAEARLFDATAGPHADLDALRDHIDRTSGHLMVLAARLLGAEGTALDAVRGFGVATGLANFLRALPDYRARGRDPLPAGLGPGEVARAGLAALARARAARGSVPPAALPALLPGWLAPLRLRRAVRDPAANLEVSEFRARAGLLWTATTGRW